jgi:hypothetical protein
MSCGPSERPWVFRAKMSEVVWSRYVRYGMCELLYTILDHYPYIFPALVPMVFTATYFERKGSMQNSIFHLGTARECCNIKAVARPRKLWTSLPDRSCRTYVSALHLGLHDLRYLAGNINGLALDKLRRSCALPTHGVQ